MPRFGEERVTRAVKGKRGGKREQAEKESEEWERRRQLSRGKGQEQGVRGSEAC